MSSSTTLQNLLTQKGLVHLRSVILESHHPRKNYFRCLAGGVQTRDRIIMCKACQVLLHLIHHLIRSLTQLIT